MLPKFSSLFSKKESAVKPQTPPPTPPAPAPIPHPPGAPQQQSPVMVPRPSINASQTRPLTPPPISGVPAPGGGLRPPLRAPLAPPTAPGGASLAEGIKGKKRVTQRITVNVPPSTVSEANSAPGRLVIPGAGTQSDFQPQQESVAGNIDVPLHVILKSLPSQVLTVEAEPFIQNPQTGATVPIPISTILSLLPSGKLEFSVKEFIPLLPVSVLKPIEEIAGDLQAVFALPLADIYPLIPAELIAKRKDQKPIDPRVIAMSDPFSEEELRRKAEEARLAAEAAATKTATETPASKEPEVTEEEPVAAPAEESIPSEIEDTPVIASMPELNKEEEPAEPSTPEPIGEIAPPSLSAEPESALASNSDLLALLAKANEEIVPEENENEQTPAPTDSIDDLGVAVSKEEELIPELPSTTSPVEPVSDFAAAIKQLSREEEAVAEEEVDSKPSKEKAEKVEEPAPKPILPSFPHSPEESIKEEVPTRVPVAEISPTPVTPQGLNINVCTLDDLVKEMGCPEPVARKILAWRELHGTISDISKIRRVPGITNEIYRRLVGLPDANSLINRELNESLGLSSEDKLTVKDVAAQIRRWPYMVACIIGGMEGLPIAYEGEDSKFADSISAFVPKLLQQTNSILEEVDENQVSEIHLIKDNRSLSIYRRKHLFLVTVNLKKDVPSREAELLRDIVAKLAELKESKLGT